MAIFTGAGVALVTPFHEDGSVNYDKLDELIDYHCEHGTVCTMFAMVQTVLLYVERQENLLLYRKKNIWSASALR